MNNFKVTFLPVSLANVMPFFSLHGLSEQTLDFIRADITSEGKELGCNSTASEDVGISHVGREVRNGAV